MKGLIVCRTGMGSSLMLKIKAQKIIDKKEKLLSNIEDIVNRGNYKAVTNLTTPHETTREVDVFKNVRPQSVVNFTLHSDELLHKNNELAILSIDNDELLFDGDQLDFIFPSDSYDIHICGVEMLFKYCGKTR